MLKSSHNNKVVARQSSTIVLRRLIQCLCEIHSTDTACYIPFPLVTCSGCFQVVDMRWGVRDDATNTHMTTELCLREIKACQEISVGPNFVVSAPLMFSKFTPALICTVVVDFSCVV